MLEQSEHLRESIRRVRAHRVRTPVLVLDDATEAGRWLTGMVLEGSPFSAFRQHHGFAVRLSNPYSGHERGSVRKAVGFLRRNPMVPVPEAPDRGSGSGPAAPLLRRPLLVWR